MGLKKEWDKFIDELCKGLKIDKLVKILSKIVGGKK